MAERYVIKVFRRSKFKNVSRRKEELTTYGVWDNEIKNWVVNSTAIGLEKAETIKYMLDQHKANKKKRQ